MEKYAERIKEILKKGGLSKIPIEEVFILGYLLHAMENMPPCNEIFLACFFPEKTCKSAIGRILKGNETAEIKAGCLKGSMTICFKEN